MPDDSTAPRVVVLVPVQDGRGMATRCIDGWLSQEGVDPRSYSLVLVCSGEHSALERDLAARLRPWDDVVRATGNEWALYDAGARHVDAPWIVLTELHCVPEPDALRLLVDHVERTGGPGARGATTGEVSTVRGRAEHTIYGEGMALGEVDGHYDRVSSHLSILDRRTLLDHGGFDSRLLECAPAATGMRLLDAGVRLGFEPRARVVHEYTGELRKVLPQVRDYGRGVARLHATDPACAARHLYEPPELRDAWAVTRPGAARLLAEVVRSRSPVPVPELVLLATRCVAGWHTHIVPAGASTIVAAVRTRLARPSGVEAAYRRLWWQGERYGRALGLAGAFGRMSCPVPGRCIDVAADLDGRLAGVGAVETWQGRRYRWTRPLLGLRFADGTAGPVRLRLSCLPLRPLADARVRVITGGQRIDARVDGDDVVADLPSSPDVVVVLVDRWRPPGVRLGRRRLGLPLASVELEPTQVSESTTRSSPSATASMPHDSA